ncbi:MAG TPA: cytochrome c [Bacteroidota bacterium]|nr:cytochrome c [Bacteroidota bacterium]
MMTRESAVVFAKFGSLFLASLVVLLVVNSLARGSNGSAETPWRTFNPTANDIHEGRVMMERNGCFSCHAVNGFGGQIGPALNGVKERKSREELFRWIKSPWSVKPGTKMPQYNLTDDTILKIISYLETKDSVKVQQ